MNNAKIIKRLVKLCNMLNANGHCWGENPSDRMCNWVDEYNGIKENNSAAWKEFCTVYGYSLDHDAFDCMA